MTGATDAFLFEPEVGVLLAGVDEAGRGRWRPVVAAAVILDAAYPIAGLADSKTLSAARREELAGQIRLRATAWALGMASVEEIDRLNILQATLLAMQRAVQGLAIVPALVLVDGNCAPQLSCPVRTVVRGDASVQEISAASILAKVTRDALLLNWIVSTPVMDWPSIKVTRPPHTCGHCKALDPRPSIGAASARKTTLGE